LHFFLQEDAYYDTPRPDLLVLDLNVPRVTGRQLLRRLRKQHILPHMPVIALTDSTAPQDRTSMAALGVDYYIVKSFTLAGFLALGQLIKEVLTAIL
jgi:DNA-binding response OmpR family regulator